MLWRNAVLLTIISVLASCGFQLRGAGLTEQDLTYRLDVKTVSSPEIKEFKRVLEPSLRRAGLRPGSPADLILAVESLRLENTDGVVDAELRVAEQISVLQLTFSVFDNQGVALAKQLQLELRSAYRIDRSQLLGSYEQRITTEKNQYQSLADQVVRTLVIVTSNRDANTDKKGLQQDNTLVEHDAVED